MAVDQNGNTYFTSMEKLDHYTKVANGSRETKQSERYSDMEQKAYARGQRDARNEARRSYAYKNSTEAQREAYKARKTAEREQWKKDHPKAGVVKPEKAKRGRPKKN